MRDALPMRAEPLDLAVVGLALRRAVAELRPDRVVISGGEPTMLPNLSQLIATINALGVRPSLCTNATLIDQARARSYADAGLGSVTVGLDGVGCTHDRFRGSARGFSRAIAGIRECVAVGMAVTVNVTLHDGIVDRPEEFAEALRDLGLASISVTAPIAQGRMNANLPIAGRVDRASVERFGTRLAAAIECPVSLRIPLCNTSTCPSGRTVFSMNRHGVVSECPDVGSINVTDLQAAETGPLECT